MPGPMQFKFRSRPHLVAFEKGHARPPPGIFLPSVIGSSAACMMLVQSGPRASIYLLRYWLIAASSPSDQVNVSQRANASAKRGLPAKSP